MRKISHCRHGPNPSNSTKCASGYPILVRLSRLENRGQQLFTSGCFTVQRVSICPNKRRRKYCRFMHQISHLHQSVSVVSNHVSFFKLYPLGSHKMLSFTDVESGGLKFFNTIQEWSHHFKNLRVLGAATPQLSIKQLELELRQLSSLSPTCFNEMCAAVASQTLIVAFRWAEFQEQVAAHGTDACLHAHNLEQELSRTKRWAKAFRDKQASAACNAGAEECTMVLFNQAFWSQVSWIQAWLLLFQGKKHDAYLLMKSGE
ncbi:hypothetical protein BJ741DRAFT_194520 [Chytriomyces cf. hyalinus JEL632]|nr:hypothetical protein BJ741DRAFT_194520 [Chytriomyces cf. hyalinus JEL632]